MNKKGRKLIEVVEKPWKRKEIRLFLTGASIYTFSVLTIVLIEVLQGNSKAIDSMLPAIAVIPAVITPSLVPRKCHIYEKGIQIGYSFVKCDKVSEYEWEDGLLKIKFKGIPRKIVIEDKEGKIKRLLRYILIEQSKIFLINHSG